MSEVSSKVTKIIVDQLGVSADEVKPEASFVEDLGADSLDLTELIMAMEEEFDIEIADDDAQKIQKVQDAVSYIESKKGYSSRKTGAHTNASTGGGTCPGPFFIRKELQ